MANLKEIRTRIASVKSTQQVTSAMKMVSAAKLRKAQDAILQMRPYSEKLKEILSRVCGSIDSGADNKYTKRTEIKKVLIIAITSNRGLCGGFNSNVVKKTIELLETSYSGYYNRGMVDVISIGKKGLDGFKSKGIKVAGNFNELYDNMSFKSVGEIAEMLMASYAEGKYDHVMLVYNQFKNAAVQRIMCEQLLPVEINNQQKPVKDAKPLKADYIFEPSMQNIIDVVIPKSLKIQFFKALLDSVASEHGARMTAMHKATDNASELVKSLKLTYNKARQASITNEILEIVSGANALQG
jgi:F-type H+-transporting ATPase subunit gamma